MRIGDAKQTYLADEAIWTSNTQKIWFALLLAALLAFPFMASSYLLYLGCLVGIAVISATGLNILTGYTGLISLGQAGFMGVGAYTVAWLSNNTALPFPVTLLAAGLLAAAVGILVGLPSLRVKGLYLAIATLAASVFLHFIFAEWEPVTGGMEGQSLQPAHLLGLEFRSDFAMYFIILPLAVLALLAAKNLFRTRVGRAFIAIRDRDISAEILGIPLLKYKLMSFALSSFYAGVAGGLFAYFYRVVTPESFPLSMSIFYLAAVIVGGMGNLLGGILGAAFMTLVPEALKLLTAVMTPIWPNAPVFMSPMLEIIFGALIVGFLIFEPHGLAEIWRRIRRFFHLWPFRS
ncbi:branched-chain amino acid ABC transporter permease [Marinobacter zhanjiangensis]|uniref:Branched-chain amino acid ABC transporter permease n=1 Tax=Marinobacter zhanjiangensis TaxID=578215 RepID=A0ABQ3AP32_9GAMM|nr:branched-chain amino acid ABC transporter permease [Marinobacter zhanjiangensis]GGY59393.1 branched-chain amino acid ABC transporter permease [Marinobacter zhanjiangensis]